VSDRLRPLLASALPLYERLRLAAAHPDWFTDSAEADHLLIRWRETVSPDDAAAFDDYLASRGTSRLVARRALGDLSWPAHADLPSWAALLTETLAQPTRPTPFADDIPFDRYWSSWLDVAARRLDPCVEWRELRDQARLALLRMLLVDLARSGTPALMHEFNIFRFSALGGNDLFLRMVGAAGDPRSTYSAFLDSIGGDGAWSFLERYPCLARLASLRVQLWISFVEELLARFVVDRAAIATIVGHDLELGTIAGIDTDLSDPHHGGRRVVKLSFDRGSSIVYKPRDVAPELAYYQLLPWINDTLDLPRLETVRVLAREGYGWMEVVAPAACPDREAVERYFERCGVHLALLSLLRGTDMHHENLIACGEQPVIVDLEALLAPIDHDPSGRLLDDLGDGVLTTGLLPVLRPSPFGGVEDSSALGARGLGDVRPRFVEVNTDLMSVGPARTHARESDSEPRVGDGPGARPQEHVASLVRGFSAAYRALLGVRDVLFGDGGPGAAFRGIRVRHVPRDTGVYLWFLRESRSAEPMRDGRLRGLFLERLGRAALAEPRLGALVSSEILAIEREDVPRFVVATDATDLVMDGDTLPAAFAIPGTEAVVRRATRMSEHDLAVQVRLIELSLLAHGSRGMAMLEPAGADGLPYDRDRLLAAAHEVAVRLRDSAIVSDGAEQRVGLRLDPATNSPRAGPIGWTLYHGQLGIAVFLAAAARAFGERSFAQAALRALEGIRRGIRRDGRRVLEAEPLGAFEGIGGIVYAFVLVGRWIGEPSLHEEAIAVAGSVGEPQIRADRRYDLVGGSAGFVMALAALHRASGEPGTLEPLARAAEHLVASAVVQERGIGWPVNGPALAGIAHGNAGIAMALATAFELTGVTGLWSGAERALDYERSIRRDDLANWPDLRVSTDGEAMTAWCHGAPGIALARSRLLQIHPHTGAREDLEMALKTARRTILRAGHLCCGMAGINDILLELGRRTGDPSLIGQAERQAMSLAAPLSDGFVTEGLMQGLAGVGYGLLRISDPAAYPCVLDLSV
jgi:type 2 lantibiotic biosynthesis protein LanM